METTGYVVTDTPAGGQSIEYVAPPEKKKARKSRRDSIAQLEARLRAEFVSRGDILPLPTDERLNRGFLGRLGWLLFGI